MSSIKQPSGLASRGVHKNVRLSDFSSFIFYKNYAISLLCYKFYLISIYPKIAAKDAASVSPKMLDCDSFTNPYLLNPWFDSYAKPREAVNSFLKEF